MTRRYLVATGTADYRAEMADPLPEVVTELTVVSKLFADLDYTRVLTEFGVNPCPWRFLAALSSWCHHADRSADDVLAVYWTGHAETGPGHYLLTTGSRPDELAATALDTAKLTMVLTGSPVKEAIFLLDTCWAGQGTAFLAAAGLARTGYGGAHDPEAGLYFIAAATPRQGAIPLEFARALDHAVRSADPGLGQEYLDPLSLVIAIDKAFAKKGLPQRATCEHGPATALPRFFPNPRFTPASERASADIDVESQRRAVAVGRRHDIDEHFVPKASGVEFAGQSGQFFTGRSAALTALGKRLTDPDGRMIAVTGAPGSGKSALLGRLVTGQVLEPSGAPVPVDAAVYARGLAVEDITSIIAEAAGLATSDREELLRRLRARGTPFTFVLDALDEAGTGSEEARRRTAGRIARLLLRPMAALLSVRVVVGTRPEMRTALGPDVFVLDVDREDREASYFDRTDVSGYVQKILLAADEPDRETPYRGRQKLAGTVAGAVARRAGRCFLVARIVARTLAAAPAVVDITQRGWRRRFPDEVGDAFNDYLSRFTPDRESLVRAVLTPLAWAEGGGLPRDRLWAPLVEGLCGRTCTDTDVGWVLEHAGAYLVESVQDGRSVYRLYHEALAEHLREERRRAEIQGRITDLLLVTVPRRGDDLDWQSAHPYLWRHLATHVAEAGRIDTLLLDPGFLLVAVPRPLLRAAYAAHSPDARAARAAYRMAVGLLPQVRHTERATVLGLAAMATSATALADRAAAMPSTAGWQPRWAHWRLSGHRQLGGYSVDRVIASVTGVATKEIDGSPVVVAGGGHPALRVWDLTDGSELFVLPVLFGDDEEWVTCLDVGELDGGPVLVTGHYRNGLARWDLDDLAASPTRIGTPHVTAVAFGFCDGAAVVAAAFDDRTCSVFGLRALDRLSGFTVDGEQVTTLAWADVDGESFLVTGSADGTVAIRGTEGEVRWSAAMRSDVVGIAAYTDGESLHVVSAASYDGVQIWPVNLTHESPREPATACPEFTVVEDDGSFTSLAVGGAPGRRLILAGATDRAVFLWEPAADRRRRLTGHQKLVSSVAFGKIEGHDVAIAGGQDATVRVWDLADELDEENVDTGLQKPVHAAVWGRCGDRELIWSGCTDGAVRAFQPDGVLVESFLAHNLPVRDIAAQRLNGGLLLATAGNDQTVMITEIADDGRRAGASGWRQKRVSAIAIGDSRPADKNAIVLVVGDHHGQVTVRQPLTREILSQYPAHEGRITAVRITKRRGQPVAVTSGTDGRIRVHQLDDLGRTENLAMHDTPIACVAPGRWMGREAVGFGTGRGVVQVIDLTDGRCLQEHRAGDTLIHTVTLTSIGGRAALITGDNAGTVRIYREGTQRPEFVIPTGVTVRAVLAQDDGLIVVATLLGMLAITIGGPGDHAWPR
jgi:WD40 repeat protein